MPLRWRSVGDRPDIDREYRCCHCLHVRTGTILLGVCQVLVHLGVMALLFTLLLHPRLLPEKGKGQRLMSGLSLVALGHRDGLLFDHPHMVYREQYDALVAANGRRQEDRESQSLFDKLFGGADQVGPPSANGKRHHDGENPLPATPMSNLSGPEDHTSASSLKAKQDDRYVTLAITLFSLGLSALLLFGAISGRPSFLLPYFCLQVFDFVITCLTVIGYFSYLPNMKAWIKTRDNVPYKHELLSMDQTWITFLVMFLGLAVLGVKSYLLGMVWACYKFLVRRAGGMERNTGFEISFPRTPIHWFWIHHPTGQSRRSGGLLGSDEEREPLLLEPESPPPPGPGEADLLTPPQYDEVLKTPANAYMPPPYYRGDADNK